MRKIYDRPLIRAVDIEAKSYLLEGSHVGEGEDNQEPDVKGVSLWQTNHSIWDDEW